MFASGMAQRSLSIIRHARICARRFSTEVIRMKRFFTIAACLVALAVGSPAFAQGVQTGTITGAVRSADGLSLPGVTVTVSSPALQGIRTATTDVNGVYSIHALPPGAYTVQFEISSFRPAKHENVELNVGGTAEINQTMALAGVTETVNVTAQTPVATPLATTTLSQVYTKREVDVLPVGRTPAQIGELAPGLNNNTFNAGQLAISGGFGYDNVYMVNGVDVNDNLFGTAHNLFIEDAVQETNILTSGISAEYGRFSGGVVNVITRSGGNNFSGSFRDNLSNPKWVGETPREQSAGIVHPDLLSKVYEGTLGGPVAKDRLWFFLAGRYENSNTANTFPQINVPYTTTVTNKRVELKGTGTVSPGQTLQASYINDPTTQQNTSGLSASFLVDPKDLVNRTLPNHLFAGNYNGVVSNRFLVTAQYSEKMFGFRNTGGTSTAIADSPFRTRAVTPGVQANGFYNAPYFDSTDPEDRDNRQITGSVSYLLSTKKAGTHDLKAGAEYYTATRIGGNSQTATGYVFRSDYAVASGVPVLVNGSPIPVFTTGVSRLENWLPQRGAQIDIHTSSLYVQDRWTAGSRLTLDLGTRLELVRSSATGDITTVDTNSIVPRLGLTYDLDPQTQTIAQVTYAWYSGKYSESQFARNTQVGNPSEIVYRYDGPSGQGFDFAPGMNPANYTTIIGGSFPTANIFNASGLKSPITREFGAALGRQLGQTGYVKGTYVFRDWTHFVEDFIQLSNGVTTVTRNGVNFGSFTNVVYDNTDVPKRQYSAIVLQSGWRPNSRTTIGAHYTLELKNDGSFVGEAGNQPGNTSIYGDFPEILGPALDRYFPEGRLPSYQRHKVRIYGSYSQPLGRFGSVDIAPLLRVNSGQVYSFAASSVPVSAIELARNPGYPVNDVNTSLAETLYFGDRGSQDFKGYGIVDLAATYSIPVWKSARPWFKIEIYNLLNNDKLIAWDTTVTADPNSAKDANGLPTGYILGPRFGQATNDNQFPQYLPGFNGIRAFRVAFGIRF
jgi:carboxypeptidase family protein/TonB-dependent receptor-like protein